ncbi:MAG: hypothetical protein A2V99_17625 [Spirochaetes bacterium RBG_16_67_19]|nr:MAG: hypothetical protein A2V99_17625 [Spirochaetes bacterium RBG_16_67_19]
MDEYYQGSSLAMWELDLTELRAELAGMACDGISTLRQRLNAQPELTTRLLHGMKVLAANPATLRLYEAEQPADLAGPFGPSLEPESLAGAVELLAAIAEGRSEAEVPAAARTCAGHRLELLLKFCLAGQQEGLQRLSVTAIDFSGQQERSLLLAVIDNLPDHIYLKDSESRFLLTNKALVQWLGAGSREELIGKSDHDFFPAEMADKFRADERAILESGHSLINKEEVTKSAGGVQRWMLTSKMPVADSTGAVVRIVGIGRDITERRALEEKNALLATLVESSNDAIVATNLEGIIQSWNKGAHRIYGYSAEQVVGRPISELLPADLREERGRYIARIVRGEEPGPFETQRLHQDGRRIQVSITLSPIRNPAGQLVGIASVSQDIGEQKALQAQILRAERLESLGTLAAGIAHQFNNINTAIQGYLDILLRQAELPERLRGYVLQARKGLQRAVDISNRLEGLSGFSGADLESLRLDVAARGQLAALAAMVQAERVTLKQELRPAGPVRVNPAQLGFVIHSLLHNALNSLAGRTCRVVTVRCGNAAGSVFLEVEDTGCGIPKENLGRLFTPFFTTKGEWAPSQSAQAGVQGVGLSLAVCQSIISEYGGQIEVDSLPDIGSTFRIRLPEEAPQAPGKNSAIVDQEPWGSPPRRSSCG